MYNGMSVAVVEDCVLCSCCWLFVSYYIATSTLDLLFCLWQFLYCVESLLCRLFVVGEDCQVNSSQQTQSKEHPEVISPEPLEENQILDTNVEQR